MDITTSAYDNLLYSIFKLLLKNGIRGLKMDNVASSLGVSKRTLYEIFDSKTDMIVKVILHMNSLCRQTIDEAYRSASNSLEGILRIFLIQRQFMCKVNVSFFNDMDQISPEIKTFYRKEADADIVKSQKFFEQGVKEGLLRKDLDLGLQFRILGIQMESLKRMEEHFPPEISLIDAYDAIYIGFLRGIVSHEGMKILDEMTSDLALITKKIEKYLYKDEINN